MLSGKRFAQCSEAVTRVAAHTAQESAVIPWTLRGALPRVGDAGSQFRANRPSVRAQNWTSA